MFNIKIRINNVIIYTPYINRINLYFILIKTNTHEKMLCKIITYISIYMCSKEESNNLQCHSFAVINSKIPNDEPKMKNVIHMNKKMSLSL